jgi:threonine 3-dehydrogenase
VIVRRLLTEKRCNGPGDSANIHFDHEVQGFSFRGNDQVWLSLRRTALELDDPRLGCGNHEGQFRLCVLGNIFQKDQHHAVREIGRQFHALALELFFSLVICGFDVHLSRARIYRKFFRVLKARTLLDTVVAQQLESTPLREDQVLLLKRTVFEVVDQMSGDIIAVNDFSGVAVRDHSSLHRAEDQETVSHTFLILDTDRSGRSEWGYQSPRKNQQGNNGLSVHEPASRGREHQDSMPNWGSAVAESQPDARPVLESYVLCLTVSHWEGALMAETMLAVVKPEAAPGADVREVKIPAFGRTDVLVKVKVASICGTDLHIYNWDRWAQNRIHPPLIPGHEFCGEVVAFGDEVTSVREGDFVSAEMHVACGKCLQCRTGEAHICQNVKIIGVDADGAFAEYVVIPESNIWKLDPAIPIEYASILDPLGNAVHTVLAGEIAAKSVAITGCGPIGLFSIAVAKAVGATSVFAIEVNEHRAKVAREMQADYVLNPAKEDVDAIIMEKTGGLGVDVVLEMAGHPDSIRTAFDIVRRGGRISLLGLTSKPISLNFSEDIIFKGITVQGINGRRMYQTWYQMTALLKSGKLNLHPVITDRIPMKDFGQAMERLKTGEASKILVYPNGVR